MGGLLGALELKTVGNGSCELCARIRWGYPPTPKAITMVTGGKRSSIKHFCSSTRCVKYFVLSIDSIYSYFTRVEVNLFAKVSRICCKTTVLKL